MNKLDNNRAPPLISVVLTTFNRAKFLSRAISSVLEQTISSFELIIVDDCSSDNTTEIVEQFKDERINYIRHSCNLGVSAARNTGIDAALTSYVSFLDDDDEFMTFFLETTLKYICQYPDIGFLWTGVKRIFNSGEKESIQVWHADRINGNVTHDDKMIFLNQFAASCGLTVAKKLFKTVGGYKDEMAISEDLDLIFRLVDSGCDYHAIPIVLITVNIHLDQSLSRSSSVQKHINCTQSLIDRNHQFMERYLDVWLHYHSVLLANYYRAGQVENARHMARAIFLKKIFYMPALERILRFELKLIKNYFVG